MVQLDAAERAKAEELQRKAQAAERQLRDAEAAQAAKLQELRNSQLRLAADAEGGRRAAEGRAGAQLQRYRTLASWKEALSAAAEAGAEGVAALRRQLAGEGEDGDAAAALDAVFASGGSGLGRQLLQYSVGRATV
jgi:hypothetical protein